MARLFHPDMHPENPEGFTVKFREITEAYETLSDPESREDYDLLYRHQVLGEPMPYHNYYEAPEETAFYTTYTPPKPQRRKPLVPYGAFGILVVLLLRILFNSTWPDTPASYSGNTRLTPEMMHFVDSLSHRHDTAEANATQQQKDSPERHPQQ